MVYNMEKAVHTTLDYRTAFYDCDHKGRMKISTLLKVTAEVAGYDYTIKGFTHDFLWNEGFVFLLSRISIKVYDYPHDQMPLVTETWEGGKKGALWKRQYRIKHGEDVLIDGTSGWILCNPVTRKIYKPSEFPYPQPQDETQFIGALEVGRIKAENTPTEVLRHTVKISDLDSNGHMYNAHYGDIVVNALTLEEFERDVDNFRINYLSEATLGEEIIICKDVSFTDEGKQKIVIIGKLAREEITPCFECEILYK